VGLRPAVLPRGGLLRHTLRRADYRQDAIYSYWDSAATSLINKESSYEILAVVGNRGLARWRATITSAACGNRFELNCVILVEFDDQQKCRAFREWWASQVLETDSAGPPAGASVSRRSKE
jgi:hypothetical protein